MQNMIMNNKYKQLRNIIENRNGSVVAYRSMIASLNTGKIPASFYTAGEYCWVRLKLNICLRIGIKLPE
jgi:hypothetical protein